MNKWYVLLVAGLLIGYASGSVIEKKRIASEVEEADAGREAAAVKGDAESPVVSREKAAAGALERDPLDSDEYWMHINELAAALDKARAEIVMHEATITDLQAKLAKEAPDRRERPPRESWQARVERMKSEEPERYAEMQKARAEIEQRVENAITEKSSFLANIDTKGMTEEELRDHNDLINRIAQGWDMMQKLQAGESLGREQMEAMRENYSAIRDLYAKERNVVLRQVGESIGFNREEATEFSKYIQEVFNQTSPRMSFGGGRGQSQGRGQR